MKNDRTGDRQGRLRFWDGAGQWQLAGDRHTATVTQLVRPSRGSRRLAGDRHGRVILWRDVREDLDPLLQRGGDWLSDYLQDNAAAPSDLRQICQDREGDTSLTDS